MSGMTNFEIRMSNQTKMTNDEKQPAAFSIRHCLFVIHSSFGFRHSLLDVCRHVNKVRTLRNG